MRVEIELKRGNMCNISVWLAAVHCSRVEVSTHKTVKYGSCGAHEVCAQSFLHSNLHFIPSICLLCERSLLICISPSGSMLTKQHCIHVQTPKTHTHTLSFLLCKRKPALCNCFPVNKWTFARSYWGT